MASEGLEVDPRSDGLHARDDNNNDLPEAYHVKAGFGKAQPDDNHDINSTPSERGQKRTVIWLSVMLALGWLLAIVAAAVAGSLAAKRLHDLKQS